MTLSNEVAKVIANGNDVATVFSFDPMVIWDNSELTVTLIEDDRTETLLVEGTGPTNYSVAVSSYPGTGSITYPASGGTPLPTGDKLVMLRDSPNTQEIDYENQGPSFQERTEEGLDRLTAQVQEANEGLSRALQLPIDDFTEVVAGDYTNVDATVDEKGRIIKIASGQGTPGPKGDPGLVWQGAWDVGKTYVRDDAVERDGSSYICIVVDSTGEPPESTPASWDILAEKGADGTGTGDMLSTNNLSDVADVPTSRVNLGLEIDVDVQSFDPNTSKTDVAESRTASINMQDNELTRPKVKDYSEAVDILGSTGGGTVDLNLELANVFTATVDTSANTFRFINPPASGSAGSFTLILLNGGSQTVNWPLGVDWPGGTAPTLTVSGTDILTFLTTDGGVRWHGFAAGLDMQ